MEFSQTLYISRNLGMLATCILLLTACAFSSFPASEYPQQGEYFILHQSLKIPANTTGLYIQDGQISGSGRSRYEPYCEIRVRKLKDSPQVINPDSFKILRSRSNTSIVKNSVVQIASTHLTFGMFDSDGPSEITRTLEMKLYSANQPDVILLDCGGVQDIPAYAYVPNRNDIQKALGKIATIASQPSR